jgi:ABC-type transport system involved in multi-copper enzyme maturation permease subunit
MTPGSWPTHAKENPVADSLHAAKQFKPRIRAVIAWLLLAVGTVLVGIKTSWPSWFLGTLFLGLFLGVIRWIARRQGGFFGPHFFYDLIRLARRSRTRDVRILYGVALLLGLGFVYWAQFPHQEWRQLWFNADQHITINEGATFAQTFVFAVIVVQNLTVLLLTPVYVGSAIAEEKETKTLDLLFATQMKDREIIFGKLFSRIVHLGAILLGGLPVLSLAQLWGGVDYRTLLANFINTGLILLSVGSVSILVSTICRKVVTAVMVIYGFVLPVSACLGIFSIGGRTSVLGLSQSDLGADAEMMIFVLAGLAAVHGMITIACLSVALVNMRGLHAGDDTFSQPLPPARRRSHRDDDRPSSIHDRLPEVSIKLERLYELPPIAEHPLIWKEMYIGHNRETTRVLFFIGVSITLPIVFLSFLMAISNDQFLGRETRHSFGVFCRLFCLVWALGCTLLISFLSASTIVRERQQRTLDALLTLPASRSEILYAKWLGCFLRGWYWWAGLAGLIVLSTLLGGFHFFGGILFLVSVFIHGAFFCSLGLFLSVISAKVLSAHGKMAISVMLIFFATWLVSDVIAASLQDSFGDFLRIGLNPLRTWWSLAFTYKDFGEFPVGLNQQIAAALWGMVFFALMALGFCFLSVWRFGKEHRGGME